jgi:hypothetical protein
MTGLSSSSCKPKAPKLSDQFKKQLEPQQGFEEGFWRTISAAADSLGNPA